MFVDRGLRTLTFAKSRKAAELIHRFTAERLGDDTQLSPVPRRLHRGRAAGDRAAARRRRAPRRLRDERARARDRHRAAGRRHLRRLSRHGRLAAPAMGARGPARQRPRRARRHRGCARPVLHAGARQAPRPARRSRDPRSHEPARARGSRARRRLRGAADRRRRDCSARRRSPQRATTRSSRRRRPGSSGRGKDHPAARVSLRSTDPDAFTIVDATTGSVLGLVERSRAYTTVHEGAVYLHRGESFLVRELDLTTLHAVVEPFARRLVHAGEEGDDDADRRAATGRVAARPGARVRRDRGDGAGRRLRAQDDRGAGADRARRARAAADARSRPRRSGSCPSRTSSPSSTRCRSCSARCTPPSTR